MSQTYSTDWVTNGRNNTHTDIETQSRTAITYVYQVKRWFTGHLWRWLSVILYRQEAFPTLNQQLTSQCPALNLYLQITHKQTDGTCGHCRFEIQYSMLTPQTGTCFHYRLSVETVVGLHAVSSSQSHHTANILRKPRQLWALWRRNSLTAYGSYTQSLTHTVYQSPQSYIKIINLQPMTTPYIRDSKPHHAYEEIY